MEGVGALAALGISGCVCVCVREREREGLSLNNLSYLPL